MLGDFAGKYVLVNTYITTILLLKFLQVHYVRFLTFAFSRGGSQLSYMLGISLSIN